MTAPARILVAEDEPDVGMLLREILASEGYEVELVPNGHLLVERAQEQPPDLILVDLLMPLMDGLEAIRQLRNDTRTSHLPMLILTALGDSSRIVEGLETGADDYIVKPYEREVLLARVRSQLRRASRLPARNPLTGLPGNVSIQAEINRQLEQGTKFALLYIDLDNFKAFNDVYGFARGDKALHLVASVLQEQCHPGDFIGHIGGDDFVVIHFGADPEPLCKRIIQVFDQRIRTLYDEADLQRGYLVATDRYGIVRQFGIISLSIAVVTTYTRTFRNYDELGRVAAELKQAAKQIAGSAYKIDQRSDDVIPPSPNDRRSSSSPEALIVCHDDIVRTAIIATLNVRGYRLLIADNEIAAQGLLAHNPHPALIVAEFQRSTPIQIWQQMNHNSTLIALINDDEEATIAQQAGAQVIIRLDGSPLNLSDQLQAALSTPAR
ncbi:MAG: GGDEF domain-containing response regulator [Chloroflexus sp.]|uniref:GGDEF domain-containing response regulator n=1 Tax=Chloroflexus sp. TaxID=1904827 RepID=UPI0040492F50